MLHLNHRARAAASPPPTPADPLEEAAERVRRTPGVTSVWFHASDPALACARHCGEMVVAAGCTTVEALLELEQDLRARNRDTIREAFRLL